jgi:flagellin
MQANSIRSTAIFNSFRHNIQNSMQSASQRIASGRRINSAADDAAGLGISQALEAQIRGLNQATRNALDFDSALNTAEGGLGSISESLLRIRDLALQASNGILNDENRASIQAEIDQHLNHISRVTTDTEFNRRSLLDGSFTNMNAQVGPNAGQNIRVSISGTSPAALGIEGFSVMGGPQNINIAAIDGAINRVVSNRGAIGAIQNRLEYIIEQNNITAINMAAANSRIADADIALEMMRLNQSRILQQMQVFTMRNQMERTRANLGFIGIAM